MGGSLPKKPCRIALRWHQAFPRGQRSLETAVIRSCPDDVGCREIHKGLFRVQNLHKGVVLLLEFGIALEALLPAGAAKAEGDVPPPALDQSDGCACGRSPRTLHLWCTSDSETPPGTHPIRACIGTRQPGGSASRLQGVPARLLLLATPWLRGEAVSSPFACQHVSAGLER
eukprot:scaffold1655_cov247-Pinguiococcus_pyrenoidosus.AAC.29